MLKIRTESVPKFIVAALFIVALNVAIWGGGLWVAAGVITSGIKAGTDQCGERFGVENYTVAGDWFCAQ